MAIQDIKSKINDNKQEKERKLLNTALHLFTEKGIKKTSIQDIVHEAGIAKGTFYLYFKDKYELQDVLLAKTSHEFFANACKKANQHHFDRLDDKIVFIIDSIINELIDRPNILKFIQKNLSLGLYSEKLTDLLDSEELGASYVIRKEINGMKKEDAAERIINLFYRTKNNKEFISKISKIKNNDGPTNTTGAHRFT